MGGKTTKEYLSGLPIEKRLVTLLKGYEAGKYPEVLEEIEKITNVPVDSSRIGVQDLGGINKLENYYTNLELLPYSKAFKLVVKPESLLRGLTDVQLSKINEKLDLGEYCFYFRGEVYYSLKDYMLRTGDKVAQRSYLEVRGTDGKYYNIYLNIGLMLEYIKFREEYNYPIVVEGKKVFKNVEDILAYYNFNPNKSFSYSVQLLSLLTNKELVEGIKYLNSTVKKDSTIYYKGKEYANIGEFYKAHDLGITLSYVTLLLHQGLSLDEIINKHVDERKGNTLTIEGVEYKSQSEGFIKSRYLERSIRGTYGVIKKNIQEGYKELFSVQLLVNYISDYIKLIQIDDISEVGQKVFVKNREGKYITDIKGVPFEMGIEGSALQSIRVKIYDTTDDISLVKYKTAKVLKKSDFISIYYNMLSVTRREMPCKVYYNKDIDRLEIININNVSENNRRNYTLVKNKESVPMTKGVLKDLECTLYYNLDRNDYIYYRLHKDGIKLENTYMGKVRNSPKRNPFLYSYLYPDDKFMLNAINYRREKVAKKRENRGTNKVDSLTVKGKVMTSKNPISEYIIANKDKVEIVDYGTCMDLVIKHQLPISASKLKTKYRDLGNKDIPMDKLRDYLYSTNPTPVSYGGKEYFNIFECCLKNGIHPEYYERIRTHITHRGVKIKNTELIEKIKKYYAIINIPLTYEITRASKIYYGDKVAWDKEKGIKSHYEVLDKTVKRGVLNNLISNLLITRPDSEFYGTGGVFRVSGKTILSNMVALNLALKYDITKGTIIFVPHDYTPNGGTRGTRSSRTKENVDKDWVLKNGGKWNNFLNLLNGYSYVNISIIEALVQGII